MQTSLVSEKALSEIFKLGSDDYALLVLDIERLTLGRKADSIQGLNTTLGGTLTPQLRKQIKDSLAAIDGATRRKRVYRARERLLEMLAASLNLKKAEILYHDKYGTNLDKPTLVREMELDNLGKIVYPRLCSALNERYWFSREIAESSKLTIHIGYSSGLWKSLVRDLCQNLSAHTGEDSMQEKPRYQYIATGSTPLDSSNQDLSLDIAIQYTKAPATLDNDFECKKIRDDKIVLIHHKTDKKWPGISDSRCYYIGVDRGTEFNDNLLQNELPAHVVSAQIHFRQVDQALDHFVADIQIELIDQHAISRSVYLISRKTKGIRASYIDQITQRIIEIVGP